MNGNLRSDAGFHGDCGSVRGSDCLRDNSVDLHDGGKNVRVSMNDDGFSHNDDENGENDEKGNDMTGCDDDDEIRSVLICGDSHDDNDRRGKGDDEGNVQSDDDGNLGRKFRGKCF